MKEVRAGVLPPTGPGKVLFLLTVVDTGQPFRVTTWGPANTHNNSFSSRVLCQRWVCDRALLKLGNDEATRLEREKEAHIHSGKKETPGKDSPITGSNLTVNQSVFYPRGPDVQYAGF